MTRPLHPGAWWAWAIALAVAASRITNPLICALIIGVVGVVVVSCRREGPYRTSFRGFLVLGMFIVVMRLVLGIVFAPRLGGTVIFTLPSLTLPGWMAGITVGGPVTVESLWAGLGAGMRLAAILACFGGVNSLASPAHLLKSLPAVLYEAGIATTIAVTAAPEAINRIARVHEARRLRGRSVSGVAGLRGVALPVLEGALDRSVNLAAAMDVRGYGHRREDAKDPRASSVLLVVGLLAICCGLYVLFDAGTTRGAGVVVVGLGTLATIASMVVAARGDQRTRHRSIRWSVRATTVTVSGFAAAILLLLADPLELRPPYGNTGLPPVPAIVAVALIVALAPAIVAPSRPQ